MYLITVKARALGRYSLRQQAKRMWLRQTTKPWSMAVGNPPDSPRYSSHVTLSRLENSSRLFSLYTQCRAQNSWLSYYCIMLLLQCVPFVHVYLPSRTPKHAGNLWPSLLWSLQCLPTYVPYVGSPRRVPTVPLRKRRAVRSRPFPNVRPDSRTVCMLSPCTMQATTTLCTLCMCVEVSREGSKRGQLIGRGGLVKLDCKEQDTSCSGR